MIITGQILKDTLVKKRGFDEDSTSCDKEFDNVAAKGTDAFLDEVMNGAKRFGIRKASSFVDRISSAGQNTLCKWIAVESSKKQLFISDIKNKVDLIEADEKIAAAKITTGIAI